MRVRRPVLQAEVRALGATRWRGVFPFQSGNFEHAFTVILHDQNARGLYNLAWAVGFIRHILTSLFVYFFIHRCLVCK